MLLKNMEWSKSGKKVIVIIDDGVCDYAIGADVYHYQVDGKDVLEDKDYECPKFSHGTICAKIIEKSVSRVIFISIRILNDRGMGNIDDLNAALRWCRGQHFDLINLSNGISFFDVWSEAVRELYQNCNELRVEGTWIFAAQNNDGNRTIPADFPSVISVEQSHIWGKNTYRFSDVYAQGKHQLNIENRSFYTEKCNSYACAYAGGRFISSNEIPFYDKRTVWNRRMSVMEIGYMTHLYGLKAESDKLIKLYNGFFPAYGHRYDCVVVSAGDLYSVSTISHLYNRAYKVWPYGVICKKGMSKRARHWCGQKHIRYIVLPQQSKKGVVWHLPRIPVVCFKGNSPGIIKMAKQTERVFVANKYDTVVLSDRQDAYLQGFTWVRHPEIPLRFKQYERPVPDILILVTVSECRGYSALFCVSCVERRFLLSGEGVSKYINKADDIYNMVTAYE